MLYDVAGVGMCVTDRQRRFVAVNREYCRTYGYEESELLGKQFTMVVPEAERDAAAQLHDDFLLRGRGEVTGQWHVIRKDGSVATIFVTAGRLEAPTGESFKVTTVYDLENRNVRGYPDHQLSAASSHDVILREIHHRVKNHLLSLQAMMSMEARDARDHPQLAQVLNSSINRIKAMSRLYDRLQDDPEAKTVSVARYLSPLIKDIVETGEWSRQAEISTEIADLHVPVEHAVSLGLILNELVANSLKHDSSSEDVPQISIAVRGNETAIELDVSDSGRGVPADFLETNRETLGIQIISAVAARHDGTIELIDPEHAGFRVRLMVPDHG